MSLFYLLIAASLGGLIGYLIARQRLLECQKEKSLIEEKCNLIARLHHESKEQFKGISAEVMKQNNETFLQLAKETLETYTATAKGEFEKNQLAVSTLVKPVKESLERVDKNLAELEKTRIGAYVGLKAQIDGLLVCQKDLQQETSSLVKALRQPRVRGKWGEIQLKRVVELAGMLEHCDFYTQVTSTTEEGRFRPDLIVRLPGNKNVIVDAKAPLEAYLEAVEAKDEPTRLFALKEHARQIRTHLTLLSRKAYWDQFDHAPEFVVLFLPAETFYSAALEEDPSLIEEGVNQKVILATPTTLIALLRAVAYGWQQENLSENAEKISLLGKELYKRTADLAEHFSKVGKALSQAVTAYNKSIGTLETRVLVSARRFKDLDVAGPLEIEPIDPIEQLPRQTEISQV